MDEYPVFSVIIPVKNEARLLERCLSSLHEVSYPRDRLEVIVSDGLSSDDTRSVALRHGARVVSNERQVVVSGRNCGFREARGDIIVFTDADCTFEADWLLSSRKYFSDRLVGGVGGLALMPPESSGFEHAVNCLFSLAGLMHASAHLQQAERARESTDIPGCNCMYRREILEKVMPVDEGLLTAEDAWMNRCIRKLGYRLMLAPDVRLWHHRRSSASGFLRQMYRFAIGRLQVGRRDASLLKPVHVIVGSFLPLFFLLVSLCFLKGLVWEFVFAVVAAEACVMVLFFAFSRSVTAAAVSPLVALLFLSGWSAGFLRELFFPLKDVRGR